MSAPVDIFGLDQGGVIHFAVVVLIYFVVMYVCFVLAAFVHWAVGKLVNLAIGGGKRKGAAE